MTLNKQPQLNDHFKTVEVAFNFITRNIVAPVFHK